MKHEQGFSMIKIMFLLVLIGAGVLVGYKIIPVYNANWKIQDTFEFLARNMSDQPEEVIQRRLPELFSLKYLSRDDVPDQFYENLVVEVNAGHIEIYSEYDVTVWILGPVEGVNPDSAYDESELKGMDKIRHKARQDFHFEPYAETP